MTYFITTDTTGQITGLYSDDEGYAPPPADADAIKDEEGKLLREGFHRYKRFNGVIVENSDVVFDETAKRLERNVRELLNAGAKAKGYDDIVNACSYAGAPNPYQAESQKYVAWRGEVWAKFYEILAARKTDSQPLPAEAELIAALPGIMGGLF